MSLESDIQREVHHLLGTKQGMMLMRNNVGQAKHVSPQGRVYTVAYGLGVGSADLIGCLAGCACPHCGQSIPWGRFIALEIKQPGAYQSKQQRQWEQMLRYNGGFYAVVRSTADAEDAYRRARGGQP